MDKYILPLYARGLPIRGTSCFGTRRWRLITLIMHVAQSVVIEQWQKHGGEPHRRDVMDVSASHQYCIGASETGNALSRCNYAFHR